LGTLFAAKASPVKLRLALAVIVLMVAARMVLGLTWHPDEIFTVSPL
jgi:membrane glycosyltransferase